MKLTAAEIRKKEILTNEFTDLVTRFEEFRESVASRLRNEWDSKSESWQEGDAGSSANEFVDAWESADFSDSIDIATFEDLPVEL